MNAYTEVLFEEIAGQGGDIGLMTLNRPQVLNSLNLSMIRAMYGQLQLWSEKKNIKAVVISAVEGRAFCAGGDLRLTYERFQAKDDKLALFFYEEYILNRFIFHYPKPYIALLNGITMGGGVGISIHGSHRVVTDRVLFAMPETGIGFFTDVGGTYFLPRLPYRIGYYLGLIGARISSDECVTLNLATHKISPADSPHLIDALAKNKFQDNPRSAVSNIIKEFEVSVQASTLLSNGNDIDRCFNQKSVEAIMLSLQQSQNKILQEAAAAIVTKSPTSLKVNFAALQAGANLDFDACMRQEYRLATRFTQGHDFMEGIRALVIDKDQKPRWNPANLQNVTKEAVADYFAPLENELI